jgi:hypothetical protein
MSKEERIKQLYELTEESNDERLLQELQELEAEYASESEIDILDELTPEQYRELMESVEESRKGNDASWEQFRTNFREWRTKFKSMKRSRKK